MAATTENPSTNEPGPHGTNPNDATQHDTPSPEERPADQHASANEGKSLYALAGAADTAADFLRGLPNRLVDAATDPSFRDQIRAKVGELPEDAKTLRPRVNEMVEQLPAKTHEFPGRVTEFIANASHDAGTTYNDLAVRGEGAVAKWRGEYGPKVDEIVDTVKSRVSQATEGAGDAVTSLHGRAADAAGDVTGVITGTTGTADSGLGSEKDAEKATGTDKASDADTDTEIDAGTGTDQRDGA